MSKLGNCPENENFYIERGVKRMIRGDLRMAIADFSQSIRIWEINATARNNRGLCYFRMKYYEDAIKDYTVAIEINPLPTIYKNRGLAYFMQGKNDLALDDYNKAVNLDPGYYKAYHNMGQVYYKMKWLPEAITFYTTSLEMNPKDPICLVNRGIVYFEMKEFKKSVKDYMEAIKLDDRSYFAYLQLGISFFFMKNFEKAIENFTKVLLLKRNSLLATFYLASCERLVNLFSDAINHYTKCIENRYEVLNCLSHRSFCYYSVGKIARAKDDHKKAMNMNRKHRLIYKYEGLFLMLTKSYTGALQKLEKYLSLSNEMIKNGKFVEIDDISEEINLCKNCILRDQTEFKKIEEDRKKRKIEEQKKKLQKEKKQKMLETRRIAKENMTNCFFCPITMELFKEPVILVETHMTYEKSAIEDWLEINNTDPMTGITIKSKKLAADLNLKCIIQNWVNTFPVNDTSML